MTTAIERIEQIDRLIDANRAQLVMRLHCNPWTSAHACQNAWDRCPDLAARERDLFHQRGIAQLARDTAEEKAYQAEQRRERARHQAAERLRRDMRAAGFATAA